MLTIAFLPFPTSLVAKAGHEPTTKVLYIGTIALSTLATGLISYVSSWLVVWSYTLAPIALVSALRETGIVFAVIIGVVFLKERLNLARLASIATTLIGTTILKFGR